MERCLLYSLSSSPYNKFHNVNLPHFQPQRGDTWNVAELTRNIHGLLLLLPERERKNPSQISIGENTDTDLYSANVYSSTTMRRAASTDELMNY